MNQLKKTGLSSNPYSLILLRNLFPKRHSTRKSLLHGFKRLIHQKQRRYIAARHSNNEQDWRKFKDVRKVVHNEIRKAHQNYINKLLDIGDDATTANTKPSIAKRFWQYIKAKRKYFSGIPILKSNGIH